jgi:hypothetical protein
MAERMYLRVRRRRNAVAALKIHLEGILDEEDTSEPPPSALVSTMKHDEKADQELRCVIDQRPKYSDSRRPSKRAKKAIWRRVSHVDHEVILDHVYVPYSKDETKKREFRVVEAILQDGDDADGASDGYSPYKRRRLTLVQSSVDSTSGSGSRRSSSNQLQDSVPGSAVRVVRKPYKILPPNERSIDDSLKQVFVGKKMVSEHYELCCTDPRFESTRWRWLEHRNSDHGNLLHACALWNDVDVAVQLLLDHQNRDWAVQALVHVRDGDGRTPLHVAELCGHDRIVRLLREATGESDDETYEFDLYCLDTDDGASAHEFSDGNESHELDGTAAPTLNCELDGGVGYWDESGQLVLSLIPPRTMSEVSVADDDEFDDPNNEDWTGNDYPDEEEEDDDFILNDDGAPYDTIYKLNRRGIKAGDGRDEDGDFDAAYGIYGQDEVAEYAFEEAASTDSN